jgi:alpha-N-arabinofuranosidase
MAQLVNVIAPIMTRTGGGVWRQTIYWPLMQASRFGRGESLLPQITCPVSDTKNHGGVPAVDIAAVRNEDGQLVLFCVNRDPQEEITLTADLRSFGSFRSIEQTVLTHPDMEAANTEADPDNVAPVSLPPAAWPKNGKPDILLPKASWNVIRFLDR